MNWRAPLIVVLAGALSACESVPMFRTGGEATEAGEPVVAPAQEPAEPEPPEAAPPPESVHVPQPPAKPAVVRAPQVQAGIDAYDNGRHREAAKLLRGALASKLGRADQVEAHKYLAFVECSLNRRRQCRDEFRKALAIDPSFELQPAEAGHPVWGPIYRNLKKQKPRR